MRATPYTRLVTLARERLAAAVAEGRPLAEVYPCGVAVYAYLQHAPEMYPTPPTGEALTAAFTGGRRLVVCEGDDERAWEWAERYAVPEVARAIAEELLHDFERGPKAGRPVFRCGRCRAFGWPGLVALHSSGWKRMRRPGKRRLLLCANCT